MKQPNKILILGKVGFQSDQIIAASWSGNTCQPSNQLIITLIRLLFDRVSIKVHEIYLLTNYKSMNPDCFSLKTFTLVYF